MKNLPTIYDTDYHEKQEKVMDLFTKSMSEAQIAKKLGMTKGEVQVYVKDWRESARGNAYLQERVSDLLNVLDEHYSKLIQEVYTVVDAATNALEGADERQVASLLGQKTTALSKIADLESKRIEVLARAGILEINDVGDQIIEMEQKQQQIMDILKEVSSDCVNCRIKVANRIAEITGKAEPVTVVHDHV